MENTNLMSTACALVDIMDEEWARIRAELRSVFVAAKESGQDTQQVRALLQQGECAQENADVKALFCVIMTEIAFWI